MESNEFREGWKAASDWYTGTFAPPGEYTDRPINPCLKDPNDIAAITVDWDNGFDGFLAYFEDMSS